jgi:hypothetical protein
MEQPRNDFLQHNPDLVEQLELRLVVADKFVQDLKDVIEIAHNNETLTEEQLSFASRLLKTSLI